MENDYKNMNAAGLESLRREIREKLENIEDEREIILERSQSGQHIGSKYIQTRIQGLDDERKSLQDTMREIDAALVAHGSLPV